MTPDAVLDERRRRVLVAIIAEYVESAEPVRSGVIQLTRWSIARADRHEGRRNLWLRTLDRLGLGFDS